VRKFLKPVVFLLAFVPLAWLGWDIYRGNVGGFPIEQAEIRTGRWALRFLLLTLAITPIRKLTGLHWIIGYRRMFGLFTFFYATVHLSMYVGLDFFFAWDLMFADIRDHRYIYIGFATYLTLIPLAITSTKGWIRQLGRKWQMLHRLVYLTLVGALLHYLWGVKAITPAVVAHTALAFALLGWRVWDWRKRRTGLTNRTGGSGEPSSPAPRSSAP
jgi:sulfoxide reductase heme-binding subunit YedZ